MTEQYSIYTYSPWKKWFSWLPVFVTEYGAYGEVVWFKTVERRTKTLDYYGHVFTDWEYRFARG